jgi:hypothetical protein
MSIFKHIMLNKICGGKHGNKKKCFFCALCDYDCCSRFLLTQHQSTKKHKTAEMLKNAHKNAHKNMLLHKCSCGRTYKHIQSYNRHIKGCSVFLGTSMDNVVCHSTESSTYNMARNEMVCVDYNDTSSTDEGDQEKTELRGMIKQLIVQNQNMLMENKEMREMVGEIIPKIGNNNTTIQNKFNLQIFLNETCKDAINLTDFVNTLELGLEDLNNTRQHGFITGITDIFVKGLNQLELNKRPIHCSDLKREVLYVKDNDIWGKDNDKNNMKQAICDVAKKQIDKIKEWEHEHPEWNQTDKGTTEYIEMIRNVTNNEQKDNLDNKIIKTIAKEVLIDKI